MITERDIEMSVPGETNFIDLYGREWKVVAKTNDGHLILQLEGYPEEKFFWVKGKGIVQVENGWNVVIELRHPDAHVETKCLEC